MDWNVRLNVLFSAPLVALYTSAWIEISTIAVAHIGGRRRTLHECVDWNFGRRRKMAKRVKSHSTRVRGLKYRDVLLRIPWRGRTLHECVDWNNVRIKCRDLLSGRTLHECVDWNIKEKLGIKYYIRVALYTSAWIEIPKTERAADQTQVALYTSAWIEILLDTRTKIKLAVALYTSAWIEIISVLTTWLTEIVALYTSAWIEMGSWRRWWRRGFCRTLHECVDWNRQNLTSWKPF